MKSKVKIIYETLDRIQKAIPREYQSRAIRLALFMLAMSVAELLSLGAIIPVVGVLMEPEFLRKWPFIESLFAPISERSPRLLPVALISILTIFILLKNIFSLYVVRKQTQFSFRLFYEISTRLHRLYFHKGYLYLRERRPSEIVRDVAAVSGRFSENVVMPLIYLFNEMIVFSFLLLFLFFYNPMALVLVGGVLALGFLFAYHKLKERMQRVQEKLHDLSAELQLHLYQSFYGYCDVKTTSTEETFFKKYASHAERYGNLQAKNYFLAQLPSKLFDSILVISVLLLLVYGYFFVPDHAELIKLLGVFAVVGYRTLPSFNRITIAVLHFRSNLYTLPIIEQVQKHKVETLYLDEQVGLRFEKEIKLQNVHLKYSGDQREILRGVDLRIRKGDCIGIIGRSSAGKTSLLNILLGFIEPTEGEVWVDDQMLDHAHLRSWYRLIGYVQQEVYIIEGTIEENIAFGIDKGDVNRDRLLYAIHKASLTSLVEGFSSGLNTELGERGAQLSVGQKQRIGIARAIYSGAEILILDEATASLDPGTENEITATISVLLEEGFTIVVVAHRYSTLRYCNSIVELENGIVKNILQYRDLKDRQEFIGEFPQN